jgi:hypothetical protein
MVFLFSFQLIYRNAVIYLYSQYQEEIASMYCENRFNENQHCKGKCYLNKQIDESPKQENNFFSLSKLKSELFFEEVFIFKVAYKEVFFTLIDIYRLQETEVFASPVSPPPQWKMS